jgi:hypothetical protein
VIDREQHTATLLADGRVLVAGGDDNGSLDSAQIYNPSTGKWRTVESTTTARAQHTAALLSDGRVLVAGGSPGEEGDPLDSAELFDPTTEKWTAMDSLTIRRSGHTATLLSDGRVLVAGGHSGSDILAASEIYDPSTGRWGIGLRMTETSLGHTATLLADGRKVLVAGGGLGSAFANTGAEIFDPGSQPTATPTAPPPTPSPSPSAAASAGPQASPSGGGIGPGGGGSGGGGGGPGPLVPGITTHIPTPAGISTDASVIEANLLLTGLVVLALIIATELLNRSLSELQGALSGPLSIVRRLQRALARLDAATLQRVARRHRRLADVARLGGIAAFYGLAFALLDPTWDPLTVTGAWLVLVMAVAAGVVGLGGDIVAWAVGRRWGVVGDLEIRAGSLLAAIGSTLVSRVVALSPGIMIGSPEAIDIDPDRMDQRRLGMIGAVGVGSVLLIGFTAWALTLGTAALRGTSPSLDVALGGANAFLLLVFAFAVQNGFVQLLSVRQSAGLALRRTHGVVWGIALLVVTFIFWHTLVNPGGDVATALRTTNALAFLATAGVALVLSLAVWIGTTLARRRATVVVLPATAIVEAAESPALRDIDVQRTFKYGPQALAENLGIDTGRAKALRWHLGIDRDPACRHDFVFGKMKVPRYSDRAIERMREAIASGANLDGVRRAHQAAGRP